jgi:hypothetical protein
VLRALLRLTMQMLALAALLYFAFFVPVGERTLYAHLSRIASTDEAQELLGAVAALVAHAKAALVSRL